MRIILFLVLSGLFSVSFLCTAPAQGQNNNAEQKHAADQYSLPVRNVIVHDQLKVIAQPSDEERGKAQERSLRSIQDWLSRFLDFKLTDALITLFNGLLVVFTLKLATSTRIAALAAKESADAAKQQIQDSAETFAKSERPYIFVSEPKPFAISRNKPVNQQPFVAYAVGSWGKSPAVVTEVLSVMNTGNEPGALLHADYAHPLLANPVLPPKYSYTIEEEAPAGIDFIFAESARDIIIPSVPDSELFFHVVIRYRGAITEGHETSVCWRYDRRTMGLVEHGGSEYNYMR